MSARSSVRRRSTTPTQSVGVAFVAMLLLASCGSEPARPASEAPVDRGLGVEVDQSDDADQMTVVTTVAPITSIVASIVGDRARVVGVVPEGINSHTFEPPPSIAATLSAADIVFLNGLQLEEPTLALARANVGSDVAVVELGDLAIGPGDYRYDFSFPESEGAPNPHLWTDPTLVREYAQIVHDAMVEIDPDGRDGYDERLAAFTALVDDFDSVLRRALDTVPEEHRKLVTYHDAYAYFADTYGWTVVGAIQPSDFGEPSPREVGRLIDQIEAEGVPAIFGSEVFPSPVLEQIAAETGADYVDDLRDDDLPGTPGDAEHSWLGLMRLNFATMVEALGGDPTLLDDIEVVDAAPATVEYPQ